MSTPSIEDVLLEHLHDVTTYDAWDLHGCSCGKWSVGSDWKHDWWADYRAHLADAIRAHLAEHTDEAAGAVERAEGEDCRRCGGPNVVWFAPSPLWNFVMRGNDINGEPLFDDLVCMPCFVVLAEQAGVHGRWRLTADPEPEGLIYETPSGRVWDAEQFRWIAPTEDTWICRHGKYASEHFCDDHNDLRAALAGGASGAEGAGE